jgi:tetratricopeptide (TPR) repeat protein
VATLLEKAGGYDDALRVFRQALEVNRHAARALAGAGECYFFTGQYAQAESYLNQALRQEPNLQEFVSMRDVARTVLELDPFMRKLGDRERDRRARRDFQQALQRLEACAATRGIDLHAEGSDPLQALDQRAATFESALPQRTSGRDSELVPKTMDLVFDMEKATSQACGEPQGMDQALTLIEREQGGGRP